MRLAILALLALVLKAASPSRGRVQRLLRELRDDGAVALAGKTRAGRWFPADGGKQS